MRMISIGAVVVAVAAFAGCSSNDSGGIQVTCGPGTELDAGVCYATGSTPVADSGVPDTSQPDTAPPPPSAPTFAGATSVAPASSSALQVTWDPGTDAVTAPEKLRYNVYVATNAGAENFAAPTKTSPPGATSLVIDGLTANGTYSVVVRAVNEAKVEDKNTVEKTAKAQDDTKAPTFAGAKAATPAPGGSVSISWDAAQDDLTPAPGVGYLVYMATAAGAENLNAPDFVTGPGAKSFTVSGLSRPGSTYYFVVRAIDAAGNFDTNKVEVFGKAGPDTVAPTFSGCNAAVVRDASSVTVSWSAASDDTTPRAEMVYDVFASKTAGGQDFTSASGTFTGVTQGVVTGLTQSTTYYFVCRARDVSGNEDTNTAERVATTLSDSTPPTFAGLKSITNITATQVDLNWDAATDDKTPQDQIVYDVFQSNAAGGENFTAAPTLVSPAGATSITIKNLAADTTVFWVVRARDLANNRDTNTVELSASTGISFSLNVQPIFTQHCAVTGCHVPGQPPLGQILSTGFAYSNIVNVPSQENPAMKRVAPSDLSTSYLYMKITAQQTVGELMPPPSTNDTLPEADKNTIKRWIEEGALNN